MRNKRSLRWGQSAWGVIWLVLFVFFLLAFFIGDLQTRGLPAIVAVLLPSEPPVTIIARNDLPAFTLLTKEKIAIMQGGQEKNPGPQDTDAIKKQEEAFYQRITLRPYSKGEVILLSDLGPKLPATHPYQIREINASASLAWIQADDMFTFTLVNTACSSGEAAPKTNPACSYQLDASSSLLRDVVVIQVGKTGQNGLTALLVAIPLEENIGSVALLNSGGSAIVADPTATITSMSTTERSFIT
jgi:hypothetical protein